MKEQILLTLCYDGMAFAGYQVQKNARTVQSAVQDAIEALYGERYDVGSSLVEPGNFLELCGEVIFLDLRNAVSWCYGLIC